MRAEAAHQWRQFTGRERSMNSRTFNDFSRPSLQFMAGVDLFKVGKSNENQRGAFVLPYSFRTFPNCLISCACCQHNGSSIAALALLRCMTSGWKTLMHGVAVTVGERSRNQMTWNFSIDSIYILLYCLKAVSDQRMLQTEKCVCMHVVQGLQHKLLYTHRFIIGILYVYVYFAWKIIYVLYTYMSIYIYIHACVCVIDNRVGLNTFAGIPQKHEHV